MITHVEGVSIFNVEDLNNILGISNAGHEIYTSRKVFSFVNFAHNSGVRHICRRQDITSDVCALHFRLQLLFLQVRILHTILQHIVTPRKGFSDEVTRMNVRLLESLIEKRPINLGYVIFRHMLSTPGVNHRLLPYSSIISKILRHF